MSYSRFGHGSNVYVYEEGTLNNPRIVCMDCPLLTTHFVADSPKKMLDHLWQHKQENHSVHEAITNICIEYSLEMLQIAEQVIYHGVVYPSLNIPENELNEKSLKMVRKNIFEIL